MCIKYNHHGQDNYGRSIQCEKNCYNCQYLFNNGLCVRIVNGKKKINKIEHDEIKTNCKHHILDSNVVIVICPDKI